MYYFFGPLNFIRIKMIKISFKQSVPNFLFNIDLKLWKDFLISAYPQHLPSFWCLIDIRPRKFWQTTLPTPARLEETNWKSPLIETTLSKFERYYTAPLMARYFDGNNLSWRYPAAVDWREALWTTMHSSRADENYGFSFPSVGRDFVVSQVLHREPDIRRPNFKERQTRSQRTSNNLLIFLVCNVPTLNPNKV